MRKSSLLVARLGNYIHDKLEKMEGFFSSVEPVLALCWTAIAEPVFFVIL